MPGPRDNSLIIRSGGTDLTVTETIAVTLPGGVHVQQPLSLHVLVPSQAGTTPTLKVTGQSLTDGQEIEVTHTENIDDATTFPFHLELPLPPSSDTSWQALLTVGGTSPDFGAVQVWLEHTKQAVVPAA